MKTGVNFYSKAMKCLALLLLTFHSWAQSKSDLKSEVISLDPQVKTGKLANGFSYYIRKGDKQDKKVTIYFVVKAGRNQEDSGQLEISHLLEHMPFMGTAHFPDAFDHFARMGIQRGTQLNAYTAYDRTVYSLIDVPSDMKVIQDGLMFFRDCAHGILLDTARVNKARPSVVEEGRSSMASRAIDGYIDKIIGNPGHQHKTARQSIENIKRFDHGEIVRFYDDWYRPNLQGIIIVGDVDKGQVESLIQSIFSDLKNPVAPRQLTGFPPFNWQNQNVIVSDKNRKTPTVEVYLKFPYKQPKTKGDFRRCAMFELMDEMLEDRFRESYNGETTNNVILHSRYYAQFPGSPVPITALSIYGESQQTAIKEVFKSAITELERIKQHGFSEKELVKTKTTVLQGKIVKPISTLYFDYSASSQMAKILVDYFVTSEVSPSHEQWKSILEGITMGEINDFARHVLTNRDNRDVVVIVPEANGTVLPTEGEISAWLTEAETTRMLPYEPKVRDEISDEVSERPIMSAKELKKLSGKVTFEKDEIRDLDVTRLSFPNGITVFLKPVEDENDNNIHMEGFRRGGWGDYKEGDYFSAVWSAALIRRSSLASYSKAELDNFTASKGINVRPRISSQFSVFEGTFDLKNAETGFQLLYQYMAHPTKERSAFDELIRMLRKNRTEKLENINKIDFDNAYEIYQNQFGSTRDFTFVLAGNFKLKSMIALVAKYLGNLPMNGEGQDVSTQETGKSNPKINTPGSGPESKIDTIRSGYVGKVQIQYGGKYDYTAIHDVKLNILKEALSNVLRKRLREKEGGTYSVGVILSYSELTSRYKFLISFECDPDRMKEMIRYTQEEIDNLKSEGVDQEVMETVVSYDMISHREKLRKADFWVKYLVGQLQKGADISEIAKRASILTSVTREDIKNVAQECLHH